MLKNAKINVSGGTIFRSCDKGKSGADAYATNTFIEHILYEDTNDVCGVRRVYAAVTV